MSEVKVSSLVEEFLAVSKHAFKKHRLKVALDAAKKSQELLAVLPKSDSLANIGQACAEHYEKLATILFRLGKRTEALRWIDVCTSDFMCGNTDSDCGAVALSCPDAIAALHRCAILCYEYKYFPKAEELICRATSVSKSYILYLLQHSSVSANAAEPNGENHVLTYNQIAGKDEPSVGDIMDGDIKSLVLLSRMLSTLGQIYRKSCKYVNALQTLQQVLEIQVHVLGKTHTAVATTLRSLGTVCALDLGIYGEDTEQLFSRALEIWANQSQSPPSPAKNNCCNSKIASVHWALATLLLKRDSSVGTAKKSEDGGTKHSVLWQQAYQHRLDAINAHSAHCCCGVSAADSNASYGSVDSSSSGYTTSDSAECSLDQEASHMGPGALSDGHRHSPISVAESSLVDQLGALSLDKARMDPVKEGSTGSTDGRPVSQSHSQTANTNMRSLYVRQHKKLCGLVCELCPSRGVAPVAGLLV